MTDEELWDSAMEAQEKLLRVYDLHVNCEQTEAPIRVLAGVEGAKAILKLDGMEFAVNGKVTPEAQKELGISLKSAFENLKKFIGDH